MAWLHLVQRLMDINLTQDLDVFKWNLHTSGLFSVMSMYAYMINDNQHLRQRYIWKLKIPLKIKIFDWYLCRGVVLTRDNLAKRIWNGSKKCCFCNEDETIQHLYLACRFAHLIWRMVNVAFNLPPPTSISNMFGNWLCSVDKKGKAQIRVGVSALCWRIWNCRNGIVFNKVRISHFLQVTHWIRTWSLLQCVEARELLDSGCSHLEMVARAIFSRFGWRFSNRISNAYVPYVISIV